MSMLSAMCERLRNIADNLSANGYTDTVRELRDAADTIDYLRCTCNDLQVDNEKLRHENETLRADAVHWKLEHCPACKNVADLQEALDENARLRKAMDFQALELGCMTDNRDVLHVENARLRQLVDAWMGCGTKYHTMQGACPMFDADAENFCGAARLAHELGIEVK